MKFDFNKYRDKYLFPVIDYLLRRKTLNYIIFFLITTTIVKAGTYANNQALARLFEELKVDAPNKITYYFLRIGEVFLVQGSLLVLVICLLLTGFVVYLKKTEISKAHSGEKFKLIQDGLEEKLKEANQSLAEAKSDSEKQQAKKLEYQKLLDKVSFTLQAKNISKSEILAKFNKKLRIIVLHKNIEDSSQHFIRDQFYPHIGAIHIHGGTCIVPPNRIDQKLSDKQILEWFETELRKFIPDDYKHNFSIVSVVDLKSTTTFNHGTELSRYKTTYLDTLEIEQILTLREIEAYLYSEKNISSRDIIDIPSLIFLTDKDSVPIEVYSSIEKHNTQAINTLQQKLGMDNLKTTDIAQIDSQVLKDTLEEHIKDSKGAEQVIIQNAKFWSDYFDRKK